MIKTVTFNAETPGPRLLVLGAVHGNEKCGTKAINRIIPEFENGSVALKNGQVTFVPICNPRAYEKDVRFTERNLNRNLVPFPTPNTYEAQIGNILIPYLERCDILLDIHSYTVGGKAFAFINPANERTLAYGAALGVDCLVSNFDGAIAASGAKAEEGNWSVGTTEYARYKGAMSITMECGQHQDPQAPEYAYQAILNTLGHLGMLDRPATKNKARHMRLETCAYRTDEGSFAREWKNFENIAKGELIATRANGEKLLAPFDGIIVLPNAKAGIDAEWYYFGREA